MNSVIQSQFLAADSSILAKLARDWDSPQRTRRTRVREFIDSTAERGILLFLTSHHCEELVRHQNDHVSESRLEFLSELPLLAWCSDFKNTSNVGNILDLNAFEIEAVERWPSEPDRIRSYVRERIIRIGSGQELLDRNADNWRLVRPLLINRVKKEQKIASLTHRPLFSETKDVTLGDALKQQITPFTESLSDTRLAKFRSRVLHSLAQQADPKLKDLEETADEFVKLFVSDRLSVENRGIHPYIALFEDAGLNIENLSSDMKLDDLGLLTVLASQLRIVCERMGRRTVTLDVLRDELLPSFRLWRELSNRARSHPKAAGSNLADRHLTSFALYIDYVQADKRTAEFVRQIRQKGEPWVRDLGSVFSAGTVEDFVKVVATLC